SSSRLASVPKTELSRGASASKSIRQNWQHQACAWVRASGEIIRLIDDGSECYFLAVECYFLAVESPTALKAVQWRPPQCDWAGSRGIKKMMGHAVTCDDGHSYPKRGTYSVGSYGNVARSCSCRSGQVP